MNVETVKYISKEQVEKLFAKITGKRDRALFALMYLYGLRCQEVVDFNIHDLRMDDRRLFVHAAKNGESGEVILKPEVIRLLKAYLIVRGDLPGALFVSRKQGRLSTTQVYRLFREYAASAKLPADKRHPHVLRHSIAVHLVEQGEDVRTIKEHLRQKNIENTMIYVKIADKRRLEIQEKSLSGTGIARLINKGGQEKEEKGD